MRAPKLDLSHGSARPSLLAKARLHIVPEIVYKSPVNIVSSTIYEDKLVTILCLRLIAEGIDNGPNRVELFIRNAVGVAAAWRDLPIVEQLQAISGRDFTSYHELADGLLGLKFIASVTGSQWNDPYEYLRIENLIAASPIPEMTNASAQ